MHIFVIIHIFYELFEDLITEILIVGKFPRDMGGWIEKKPRIESGKPWNLRRNLRKKCLYRHGGRSRGIGTNWEKSGIKEFKSRESCGGTRRMCLWKDKASIAISTLSTWDSPWKVALMTKCYGSTYAPLQNLCLVLIPSTSECDHIWRKDLYRDHDVKMRLLGWILIQDHWHVYKRKISGQINTQRGKTR